MERSKLWSKRMRAFDRSGLTRRAWCLQEVVSLSSLDYWRRRLRTEGEKPALVPIVVAEHSVSPKQGVVEIDVAGLRLRADSGLDATWQCSVLRGLR